VWRNFWIFELKFDEWNLLKLVSDAMSDEFESLTYEELPEAAKSLIKEDTPLPAKMVMADGVMPLPTRELVMALYYFIGDSDKELSGRAETSLLSLPSDIMTTAIDLGLPAKILNFVVRRFADTRVLERVALNAATPDSALEYLASHSKDSAILDIISTNQRRWFRHPDIARSLINNLSTPTIIVTRLKELMRLEGISLRPTEEEGEAAEVPTSALEEIQRITQDLQTGAKSVEELQREAIEYLPDFAKDLVKEDLELTQDERQTLSVKLKGMRPVDQMRLAFLGGIEARNLLLRSPVRMVREAVLDNPKITSEEILRIVRNKSMSEEIIHKISKDRDWTRNYRIMFDLIQNPKTPLQFSLKFLERLWDKDLADVARSKQVPGLVAATAKNIFVLRQKRK